MIFLKHFLRSEYCFPFVHLTNFFLNLFCLLIFLWFKQFFIYWFWWLLYRENWRGSTQTEIYFLVNVELTSTFLLYRGLVHHHHRILNLVLLYQNCKIFGSTKKVYLYFLLWKMNNITLCFSGSVETSRHRKIWT